MTRSQLKTKQSVQASANYLTNIRPIQSKNIPGVTIRLSTVNMAHITLHYIKSYLEWPTV